MIRQPVVAGQFYPGTKHALEQELSRLVPSREGEEYHGMILPHAGYAYSGAITGKTIAHVQAKSDIIILGPKHTDAGEPFSVMTWGWWRTPLGDAPIKDLLGKDLLKHSAYLKEDSAAHREEHSIEVLLPFLQYRFGDFRFLPIAIGGSSLEIYRAIGAELAAALKRLCLNPLIIASTDMTHYESQRSAEEKDRFAIDAIVRMDEELLIARVKERRISMCGVAPVCVLLACLKQMGIASGQLIQYATSADYGGDYESVVGYAGMLFR